MSDFRASPRSATGLTLAGVLLEVLPGPLAGMATASPQPSGNLPIEVQNRNDNHVLGVTIALHEGGQPGTATPPTTAAASVPGIDVSSYQGNVNWQAQYEAGKRFAYVKTSEGTPYKNAYLTQQYNGSYNVGMIRGAYHFARPDRSGGASQASFFVRSGGAWSGDGKTLPGALDLEYNPYGVICFGKSKTSMTAWIRADQNRFNGAYDRLVALARGAAPAGGQPTFAVRGLWEAEPALDRAGRRRPLCRPRMVAAPHSMQNHSGHSES